MLTRLLPLLLLLLSPLAALAQRYAQVNDIPYSQATDPYSLERCKLDVYYPEEGIADAPVVVWFHGGGLMGGSKFIPNELKSQGFVVIGVNYRLLPNVAIDACNDDAAAAVAWAFRNAHLYNGSPRKIFVSGHSAGGYLTSMIGLDKTWLAKYGIDADSIAGLIPFSGQAVTHFNHRKMQGIPELQPTIDATAPIYHVRAGACPPYIIITGDRNLELYGRYEENAYLWRMLTLAGHPDTALYELDGYNHGDMAAPAFHILKNEMRRILSQGRKK